MPDARDFHSTVAQVLPVLLLTIVWDRDWLARLPGRRRRTATTPGVRFWTKPFVRWYSITLTVLLVMSIGTCVLVLAGAVNDAAWLRGVLVALTVLALATLAVRISAGVADATR